VVVPEDADFRDFVVLEYGVQRTEAEELALRVANGVVDLDVLRQVPVVAEGFGFFPHDTLDAMRENLVGLGSA
jgi:hypothetical protein